jgi:adenylate cyclase
MTRGYQARREHRLADAKEAFAEAVALYRKSNNPRLLAQALVGLGQVERDLGETDFPLAHYEEAVAIFRGGNDPLTLAHAIRHVADILRESGRLAQAVPHYEEALDIYLAHDDPSPLDLANAIRGFALVKGELGEFGDAKLLWTEARVLYEGIHIEAGVAESDRQIGLLTAKLG